jgi:hypothetical protein
LVTALIGVCLLALMGYVLNAPAKGTIVENPKLKLKPSANAVPTTAPLQQSNTYYSLHLPVGFSSLSSPSTPAGLLSAATLKKNSASGTQLIAIAIKNMPDGGMTNDSAYQLRSSQSAHYTLTTQSVDNDQVRIATDTQSAGVVAFWPHGNLLATISISETYDDPSSSSSTVLSSTLQTVLQSWQWQ